MADKRITDLPILDQAEGGDYVPIVDSSMNVTKRVTPDKVVPIKSLGVERIDGGDSAGVLVSDGEGNVFVDAEVKTEPNPGSGGGTWTYWSMAGLKFATIKSMSISYGNRESIGFTYPPDFFDSIITITATSTDQTSDGRQYANVSTTTSTVSTNARWQNPSSASTSQTGRVSLLVIGT